jgi:hypothetical protein
MKKPQLVQMYSNKVLSVSDRNSGPMKGQEMEGSTKHILVRRVTPALLQQ